MKKKLWLGLLAALVIQNAAGQNGDDRIVAAREAARTGNRAQLEAFAALPEDHPLEPYVQYWLLSNKVARPEPPPEVEILSFIQTEPASLLAERLRGEWLKRLAKDGEWDTFAQLYPGMADPDRELQCHAWNARWRAGDAKALDEVMARWGELADAPSACEPVLQILARNGQATGDDRWWRFRLQMEGKSPGAARVTLSWLPPTEAPADGELDRMLKNPALYVDRLPPNFAVSHAGRELALGALVRVARDDPHAAYARFSRLDERFQPEERAYMYGVLGWAGSRAQLPEALRWYRAAGDVRLGAEGRAWRVRAALRAGDWKAVQQAILAMPASEQSQPEWTYWLGRAQAARGDKAAAKQSYERVAGQPSFYGILAGEELGRPFVVPPQARAACVAGTTASCWRRPAWPRRVASTTEPSAPPTAPGTSMTTACATSRLTGIASSPTPGTVTWTSPGCMA